MPTPRGRGKKSVTEAVTTPGESPLSKVPEDKETRGKERVMTPKTADSGAELDTHPVGPGPRAAT